MVASPTSTVYVSYASPDAEDVRRVVQELKRRLEPRGIRVWMDQFNLRVGEDWYAGIERVRRSARVWLFFWGRGAQVALTGGDTGRYFREELAQVERATELVAIPVLLPGSDWKDTPQALARRQGVRLLGFDGPEVEHLADQILSMDTSDRAPESSAEPQGLANPTDLPAPFAELLQPERTARLLARMALSYPDILPCLQIPESAKLHAALRQLQVSTLESLLALDRVLTERFHDFEPNALWLATVQTIHGAQLARVIDSIRAMPVAAPGSSAEGGVG